MFKLFFDSDCDVTLKMAKEEGFGLISMPYEINGETVYPYETWEEYDHKAFNQLLIDGKLGKTFAVTVDKYINYFEPVLKEGNDILYISFSAQMSSTFSQYDIAIEQLKEKYPERTIRRVDTYSISIGSLVQIFDVLDMYKAGKSLDEIATYVEENKMNYSCYFFVDDLKHFARSGRVSNTSAFVGNIIGIKPIIHMDELGKMSIITKVKGRMSAMQRVVQYMDEHKAELKNHKVCIAYGYDEEFATTIANLIQAKYGKGVDLVMTKLNPTAGCHCGPHVGGVSFYGSHR